MKWNSPFSLLFLLLFCCSACNNTAPEEQSTEMTEASEAPYGGLALYTLRDTLAKNPREVLRAVADIGYRYIESANYEDGKFYGMAPAEFKAYLEEIGLMPVSAHQSSVTLDNADQMIADTKAAGFRYFVIPIPPMGHFKSGGATQSMGMSEEVETVTDIINTIGQKCTAAGLELLYHNHDFEFKANAAGIVPLDYFIEHTDPQYVNFQLDLYWATKAGEDPVAWFNKAPGRFKSWHVKDMDEQGRFAPVGAGSIDFARILAQRELAGLQYYFVEQDRTFGIKPMEAIKISHDALKTIGFSAVTSGGDGM